MSIERYVRHASVIDQDMLLKKKVALEGSGYGPEFMHYCLAGLGVGGVANDSYRLINPRVLNPRIEVLEPQECNERLVLDEEDPVVAGIDAAMLVVESCTGVEPDKGFALAGSRIDKDVAVIGAGGIGTYAALFVGLCGATVDVYDHDDVEASNLNRQVFYQDHLLENKALALKSELPFLREAYDSKLDEDSLEQLGEYDAVLSCVDNAQTRLLLDDYCHNNRIPLIDGGTSSRSGRVNYCGARLQDQIRLKREAGGRCMQANPSVVMPNMIIGAIMAARLGNPGKESVHYSMRENTLYERRIGDDYA